jgi:hypothetical protein
MNNTIMAPVVREQISGLAIHGLENIHNRLHQLEERLGTKLLTVCMAGGPIEAKNSVGVPTEEWPGYYSRMRELSDRMDNCMNRIDEMLDRCEVGG